MARPRQRLSRGLSAASTGTGLGPGRWAQIPFTPRTLLHRSPRGLGRVVLVVLLRRQVGTETKKRGRLPDAAVRPGQQGTAAGRQEQCLQAQALLGGSVPASGQQGDARALVGKAQVDLQDKAAGEKSVIK